MSKQAASIWAQRAFAEVGARKRFNELGKLLVNIRASNNTLQLAKKAFEDEGRHAKLCYSMAKQLGHKKGVESVPHSEAALIENNWQNESLKNRVLCEVVQTACFTETINASLLDSILRKNSEKSQTGRVIKSIYLDEMSHGQFGWVFLAEQANQRDIQWLSDYLPEMIKIVARDELFQLNVEASNDEDFKNGVLPSEFRVKQFRETIYNVVLPGFELFNIDTTPTKQWLETRFQAG